MKIRLPQLQKIIKEEVATVRPKSATLPRDLVLERWQKLAGLFEGLATDEVVKDIKDKKIKNDYELESAVKGYSGDALKDLESNKGDIISAAKRELTFPRIEVELDRIIGNLKKGGEKPAPDESKPEEKADQSPSAGDKGEEKVAKPQAAAAAAKTFKGLIGDARNTIKPEEVSDQEMGAIMSALDKLAAFKIK